jgi:hypothetical protein
MNPTSIFFLRPKSKSAFNYQLCDFTPILEILGKKLKYVEEEAVRVEPVSWKNRELKFGQFR